MGGMVSVFLRGKKFVWVTVCFAALAYVSVIYGEIHISGGLLDVRPPAPLEVRKVEPNAKFEKPTVPPKIEGIDIVIPWSGLPQVVEKKNGVDVARDRYNGELPYLLRSIAQQAPWVRMIFILVNGEQPKDVLPIPASIVNRTRYVDRCTFMPKGSCPSRNGMQVMAFVHRLPELAEKFIYTADEVFLGLPALPKDFFNKDGKPYVWRKAPRWGEFRSKPCHRLYSKPNVVNFTVPRSSHPNSHVWYPQLKSVCALTESAYPSFYAFVASHAAGRYSSNVNNVSDAENSQEEDWVGWMNCEYLRTGTGVFFDIDEHFGTLWDEVVDFSEAGFERAVSDPPFFMNVNDHFNKSNPVVYKQELEWFTSAMETLFPKPATVFDFESARGAPATPP